MRAALSILGVLCGLGGAGILLLMLRWMSVFTSPNGGLAGAFAMWASHFGAGAVLLVLGLVLLRWAGRFP